MAESKTFALNFGEAIAFVAPGFLAFKAVSYFSGTAQSWLAAAATGDLTVGPFLFVLLASTVLGIAVSGFRALLIDNLFHCRWLKGWRIGRPDFKWNQLDGAKLESFKFMNEGYYRYFQFYSNSLIALLILLVARFSKTPRPAWTMWYWLAAMLVVGTLFWSAHDSYSRYAKAVNELFSGASQTEEP